MSNDAYTLKKHEDSGELHLFKGKFNEDGGCTSGPKSICQRMDKGDAEEKNVFSCQNEDDARMSCAKKGRAVCGTCVSSLYATEND